MSAATLSTARAAVLSGPFQRFDCDMSAAVLSKTAMLSGKIRLCIIQWCWDVVRYIIVLGLGLLRGETSLVTIICKSCLIPFHSYKQMRQR